MAHDSNPKVLFFRNSRRLKDAPERVERTIRQLRDRARVLTVADCEGDAAMTVDIQTTLRAVADELSLRGRYLKLVP